MPAYSDHLVAFYDILGFSQYVRANPGAGAVDALFSHITRVAGVPEQSTETLGQRHTHFSDTIIRTTPFINPDGSKNRFGILFHELNSAVHFQIELVWRELVWLRGAITYGPAFHDENAVYGPAIIQAYELEKDVAIYPRVVVDPVLLTFFENSSALHADQHDLSSERDYVVDQLRRGDDGVWFVDYLRAAQIEADEEEQYAEFLARHKRMILKTLTSLKTCGHLSQKYTWLARYHNEVLKELSDHACMQLGIDRPKLLITPADTPLLYDPPQASEED